MIKIGDRFPQFSLKAVPAGAYPSTMEKAFFNIDNTTYKGKWLVIFSWPKDFTFVCPTEIATFAQQAKDFADRDAQVLGFSTDSEFVHLAWKRYEEKLKDLQIPMLSDIKRELATSLGILDDKAGVCQRATFIVDPEGIVRFVYVTDLSVGRNVSEVMRVLDALQTDELCPCNWKPGDATIK